MPEVATLDPSQQSNSHHHPWSWNQTGDSPDSGTPATMENVDLKAPPSNKPGSPMTNGRAANGHLNTGNQPGIMPADSSGSSSAASSHSSKSNSWNLEEVAVQPPREVPKKVYRTGNHMKTVQGLTFWLISDCCGLTCAVFTYLLLLYGLFMVNGVMLAPFTQNTLYDVVNFFIFNFLVFMAYASHIKAMCTDPGTLAVGTATKENIDALNLQPGEAAYKCTKCDSLKPPRAHHCSVCRRCVRKMDHHCPWINNCVGEDNQKFFVLFTLYIAALSLHGGSLCLYTFYKCVIADWGTRDKHKRFHDVCPSGFSPAMTTVLLALCAVEAILFFLFTLIMFCTQISNVMEDSTGIEQLKREDVTWEKSSGMASVRNVFGERFSFRWFSPFHPSSYHRNRAHDTYKYSPLYNV